MAPEAQPASQQPSRFRRWITSTWAFWTVIGLVIFRATGFGLEYAQTGTISALHRPIMAIWVGWVVIFFVLRRFYA
jgi:hypothetical protein